jgi:hypothetical protein
MKLTREWLPHIHRSTNCINSQSTKIPDNSNYNALDPILCENMARIRQYTNPSRLITHLHYVPGLLGYQRSQSNFPQIIKRFVQFNHVCRYSGLICKICNKS